MRCSPRAEYALIAAMCAVAALAGCATLEPPKPWEKGDLARPSMRFDVDLAARDTQHIYQSKEGAAGGGTVGGGGCGCN